MASILKNRSDNLSLLAHYTLITLMIFITVSAKAHDHDHQDSHSSLISMELIHRDSPKSPFYSPSQTPWQRIAKALKRSHHRANHIKKLSLSRASGAAAQSELFPSGGEYLMNISLGTPPKSILAIADTGSDLIWTQCKPCQRCFKQQGPLFNTKASSTYKPLSCAGKPAEGCESLGQDYSCDAKTRLCRYNFTYADGSFSLGNVATETVTLFSPSGKPVRFPGAKFGCGFRNGGIWSGIESGIVGLGSGELSLVSQMGPSINGRFSYCLVPMSSFQNPVHVSSKIDFGGPGLVPGGRRQGVVSTPLLSNGTENYYYLALRSVSLGRKRFELHNYISTHKTNNGSKSKGAFKGNIIIDSGTMLTFLPPKLYKELEKAMRSEIRHLKLAKDPSQIMSLCYETKTDIVGAPALTFHFEGGADVRLKTRNAFLRTGEDVVCFAFVPSDDDILVYGNVAQMDFLVEYDLKNKVLALKPTDCKRYK